MRYLEDFVVGVQDGRVGPRRADVADAARVGGQLHGALARHRVSAMATRGYLRLYSTTSSTHTGQLPVLLLNHQLDTKVSYLHFYSITSSTYKGQLY